MVAIGRTRRDGSRSQDGELVDIADLALVRLTGERIRTLHRRLLAARGERRATYAMQVLRALMNWHGAKPTDNPLGRDTAGKDRIAIPQARARGRAIPVEK